MPSIFYHGRHNPEQFTQKHHLLPRHNLMRWQYDPVATTNWFPAIARRYDIQNVLDAADSCHFTNFLAFVIGRYFIDHVHAETVLPFPLEVNSKAMGAQVLSASIAPHRSHTCNLSLHDRLNDGNCITLTKCNGKLPRKEKSSTVSLFLSGHELTQIGIIFSTMADN